MIWSVLAIVLGCVTGFLALATLWGVAWLTYEDIKQRKEMCK